MDEFNRRKIIRKGICTLLLLVLAGNLPAAGKGSEKDVSLKEYICTGIQDKVRTTILPLASFQRKEKGNMPESLLKKMVLQQTPFLLYAESQEETEEVVEESYFLELLLKEQLEDIQHEAEAEEKFDDMLAAMETENAAVREVMTQGNAVDVSGNEGNMPKNEMETLTKEAQNAVSLEVSETENFQKVMEKQRQYDFSLFADADSVIKEFYAVDSTTSAAAADIRLEEFLNKDLTIDKNTEGFQILIFHTHSQEAFADSVPGDSSTTIVGAGERLAEILTREYGYKVLHHTGEYDVEFRDDAYSKALPAVEQILKEYPEIQVVIDLHRDEVAEGTKLVTDIQGRPTAKVMFFNGLSFTKQTGKIGYLENPNLSSNLAFSLQMQVACGEYYPGFTRRIYLKGYRYNMHLKDKFLLVELGAQTNTVEEIQNACDPLAQMLDMVLSGMVY